MRLQRISPRSERVSVSWIRRFVRSMGSATRPRWGSGRSRRFRLLWRLRRGRGGGDRAAGAVGAAFSLPGGPGVEVGGDGVNWPRARLPAVLSQEEVGWVLSGLSGTPRLVATILYGSGMRLLECLTRRVKDVDLDRGEIRISRGKGGNDRVTVLAEWARERLRGQLERCGRCMGGSLRLGEAMWCCRTGCTQVSRGGDELWVWQWVFLATLRAGTWTG